jgi:hypothetical protein
MADFNDPEAFYASGAKDKVLADLQGATRSTHNLTETLNLWSHQGYRLNADAADSLVTELLQAVYTVSKIGLVQHALAAGSETQSIALRAQAPPATAPSPPSRPSRSGPLPRSSNATSDPAGLRCPVKKALFVHSHKRPLPSNAKSFATAASAAVALPQPSPPKRRKGAATAQAGLVQMAKSFPSAPTAAIVHAQQVVSSAAIVAPSDSDRAKARRKRSTTHGPSCKEVVVITSLPTHWPDKPVVGLLNSYLGTHGRAIRAITETRNHLRGLALVCDILPVEADIQVMHAYFDAAAKRIREDNTTETRVEVGSSKSFLCIPDFPYFGAKLTYDTKGEPVPVTPLQVKEILLASKWKDTIHIYQGAMPCLVRNSRKSDTCMVFFDIYNSRGGHHLQSLKGSSFMLGHITLTIQPAEKWVGVPICPRCWRYGHRTPVCPFKTQLCAICAGPHQSEHHQVFGACCKAQPKAKPPREATPLGHSCPHPVRCVNCGLAHSSDSSTCSFWKHRYDPKWVHTKYTAQKVGNELLRFIPATNFPFPNVTGGRILRRRENPQEIRHVVD